MELLQRSPALLTVLAAAVCLTAAGRPAHVFGQDMLRSGETIILICAADQAANTTALWRRSVGGRPSELLTSGSSVVTSDPRVGVTHVTDSGVIRALLDVYNVTVLDSGLYVCEVNSRPPISAFHSLTVISTSLEAPLPNPVMRNVTETRDYDFRSCCQHHNVAEDCLQLCTLRGMRPGGGFADQNRCQSDFPSIFSCMADARDHRACCMDQGVPPHCGDFCRGNYVALEDSLASYLTCSNFTVIITNCVALGIETLPAAPASLQVRAVSLTALQISWQPGVGHVTTPPAEMFTVNVTRLRSFDGHKMALLPSNATELTTQSTVSDRSQLFDVVAGSHSVTASNLAPLTMYEVSVTARAAGGSRPSPSRVRAVTWAPDTRSGASEPPQLPDVRRCCTDGGVTEPRCLQHLCDPARASAIDHTDLVECAPWTRTTLTCMAADTDHSACCRASGLPPLCATMCSDQAEQLDYRHFACLQYMPSYASCLMQGYGVLASAPLRPRVALTDGQFALLRWDAPERLPDTVLNYILQLRRLDAVKNDTYTALEGVHSPLLLEHLLPDQPYEFYLTAVNRHGEGAQSSRIVFRTLSQSAPEATEAEDQQHQQLLSGHVTDVSDCCRAVHVSSDCQHLCNVTPVTFRSMPTSCTPERHKILQCVAGWRDHTPCCLAVGLPDRCLPTCRGQGPTPDSCLSDHAVTLLWCLASGADPLLPPPVSVVRVTRVTGHSVTVGWETAETVQQYQVRYGNVNRTDGVDMSLDRLSQTVNVSGSGEVKLSDLTSGVLYAFTVLAMNEHGFSLPASVVIVNITDGALAVGSLSSPHSLSASEVTATAITLTWSPPDFAPHNSSVRYRLYYWHGSDPDHHFLPCVGLSRRLDHLLPNTAYDMFVTAETEEESSAPSETLRTWTAASAVPASVQSPEIRPVEVTEGDNITVLCAAAGIPVPNVELYINGERRNQSRTHLLVMSVSNVTRYSLEVTCLAENGGPEALSTLDVIVQHGAVVDYVSEPEPVVSEGGTVELHCHVMASPRPTLTWRDPRNQTISGGSYTVTEQEQTSGSYTMELRIERARTADLGGYSCTAENSLGADTKEITLRRRAEPPRLYQLGVAECCRRLSVSPRCQGACADHQVDLETVLATPGCVREFSKLMECAADGSDHSDCCSSRWVPDHCLPWCEGRPVTDRPDCAAQYATDIIGCFEEGKEMIPGPPRNIRVKIVDTTEAEVSWDPPSRNAEKVVIYRLSWRRLEEGSSAHLDTRRTGHVVSRLEAGARYQLSVRAANRQGSSLPATLNFSVTADPTSAQSSDESTLDGRAVLGLALALALLVLVLGGVWLVRRRRLKAGDHEHLVSFANPTFLREEAGDGDGAQECPDVASSTLSHGYSDGGASGGGHSISGSDDWQETALRSPTSDDRSGL